jgi:cytochrome c oxidase assembly protein subunit 15
VVTAVLLLTLSRLWQVGSRSARRLSGVMGLLLVLQLSLGVSNVVASLPLAVAVAHNAVGALLLLSVVTLAHRSYSMIRV